MSRQIRRITVWVIHIIVVLVLSRCGLLVLSITLRQGIYKLIRTHFWLIRDILLYIKLKLLFFHLKKRYTDDYCCRKKSDCDKWSKHQNRRKIPIEKLRDNMCETPYSLSTGNSRSRALLTTANLEPSDPAYQSLPRVVPMSSHGIRGGRPQGYGSLSSGNFASAGYGPRGHSAQVRMGPGGVLPTIQ